VEPKYMKIRNGNYRKGEYWTSGCATFPVQEITTGVRELSGQCK
jgi:hypothetical protein